MLIHLSETLCSFLIVQLLVQLPLQLRSLSLTRGCITGFCPTSHSMIPKLYFACVTIMLCSACGFKLLSSQLAKWPYPSKEISSAASLYSYIICQIMVHVSNYSRIEKHSFSPSLLNLIFTNSNAPPC